MRCYAIIFTRLLLIVRQSICSTRKLMATASRSAVRQDITGSSPIRIGLSSRRPALFGRGSRLTHCNWLARRGFGWLRFPGSAQINDIINTIGRAGVRVGTSFDYGNMILQPFASVNVYHDFSGDWSANYSSCPQCIFVVRRWTGFPAQLTASINGTGVGTYGTYSLGVAGQIKNTGWLGYLRVDYTNGSNLEGWTGSGGIRYQFTPEAPRPALITKAPVKAAPVPVSFPVNWTGFYLGGVGGGAFGGHADATFAPAPRRLVVDGIYSAYNAFPGATSSSRLAGILGGGEIGYNYQMGPWVLGLEADLAWTNARGSKACGNLVSGFGGKFPPMHCSIRLVMTISTGLRL